MAADLPQRNREEIQTLKTDGLIGCHQHPSPLVELHQIALGPHGGLRQLRTLLHPFQALLLLAGYRGNGAVIHSVKLRGGSGDGRQHIVLLHTLPHHSGYKFRKQHRRLRSPEELLHHIRAAPLHMDVEPFQLPLKGVQSLQRRAPVVLAGVRRLQHLREGLSGLPVHPLFQSQIVESISHIPLLLKAKSLRSWQWCPRWRQAAACRFPSPRSRQP